MQIYTENIKALGQTYPHITEAIEKIERDNTAYGVETTPGGHPTIRVNNRYLHSKYDPIREAQRSVAAIVDRYGNRSARSIFVVSGFGLGYHVEELLRLPGNISIIILIADVGLFVHALSVRSLEHIITNRAVRILIRPAPLALVRELQVLVGEDIIAVNMPALVECDKEYYSGVAAELRKLQVQRRGNQATTAKFSLLWVRNILRNYQTITRAHDFSRFQGACTGAAAVVVGAGPSLDSVRELLPGLCAASIVIAVDTALLPLQEIGVTPDITVTADPQFFNSQHIRQADTRDLRIIFDICSNPAAAHPRTAGGNRCTPLLTTSAVPMAAYVQNACGIPLNISGGGSVVTMAWEVAHWLGCTSIYLAGVDLGYPGRALHCRGTYFEERMYAHGNYLHPAETGLYRYLHARPHAGVADYRGTVLRSDESLLQYGRWLQKRVSTVETSKTINICAESLMLDGIPYIDPKNINIAPGSRTIVEKWRRAIRTADDDAGATEAAAGVSARNDAIAKIVRDIGRHVRALQTRVRKQTAVPIDDIESYISAIDRSPVYHHILRLIYRLDFHYLSRESTLQPAIIHEVDKFLHLISRLH